MMAAPNTVSQAFAPLSTNGVLTSRVSSTGAVSDNFASGLLVERVVSEAFSSESGIVKVGEKGEDEDEDMPVSLMLREWNFTFFAI